MAYPKLNEFERALLLAIGAQKHPVPCRGPIVEQSRRLRERRHVKFKWAYSDCLVITDQGREVLARWRWMDFCKLWPTIARAEIAVRAEMAKEEP